MSWLVQPRFILIFTLESNSSLFVGIRFRIASLPSLLHNLCQKVVINALQKYGSAVYLFEQQSGGLFQLTT